MAAPLSSTPVAAATTAEGERKQVTVLFADVVGSMDLAEHLDPEDWARTMGRLFRLLSDGVLRFGGTVDKFTGDGIMALFGAPISQEDHAHRACHAALRLRAATADLDLQVRFGLNSGEVVVGGIGEHGRLEYTALGHTVGLAQRMEALADPGEACLTEATARLVRNEFALRDLGMRTVKGARDSLRVFALEAWRRRRATAASVVMVGRGEEMGVLEAALARALEGKAQVVGVVGEAGVGKSRLCEEFARSAAAKGITVRRTTGLSHARDVPLLPVLGLLRDYFGIDDSDSRAEAQRKIAARLLALDARFEDALPLLFDFLEVPDEELPAPRLSPEVRMQRILTLIRRITQRRSEREALILVFEDLQWFDSHSQAFVDRLILSFPGTRTLVLTNFRPGFSPPWASLSYYRQLPLQPLDGDSVGRLLDSLLGRDESLDPLFEMIADTTGGSPFFIEEVVRSLVEDGTLSGEPGGYRLLRNVEHLAVPPTVQATLAARIDRLTERDREILQTSAVIGRNFIEPVVRRVSGLAPEEIAESLRHLEAAEFLQEVAVDPIEEYRFWHPLTQEVAYGTLLRERRAAVHRKVAEAIIATESDRLDERAALLATHFEEARDPLEAARWNDRAGDFALRSDLREAMRRWRTAVTHLESAPRGNDALELGVRVRTRLIRYGARTGMDPAEAGHLYFDARAAAAESDDPQWLAAVTHAYATTRFWRGMISEALGLYREAAELVAGSGEDGVRAAYGTAVAVVSCVAGVTSLGTRMVDEVENLVKGDPLVGRGLYGFSVLAPLALSRAELFALHGRWDDAHRAMDDGLTIARAGMEPEWISWLLSIAPRLARTPGEFEASLDQAQEGVRVAEECGNTASHVVSLAALGIAQSGLGRHQEAVGTLRAGLEEARSRQAGLFEEARLLVHLARAHVGLGDGEEARSTVTEAVNVAHRQGAPAFECVALLTRAQVMRRTGTAAGDVAADLDAAWALAREMGATTYEAEIEAERGEAVRRSR